MWRSQWMISIQLLALGLFGCGRQPSGPAAPRATTPANRKPQDFLMQRAALVKDEQQKLAFARKLFESDMSRIVRQDKQRSKIAARVGNFPDVIALPRHRAIRESPESFAEEFALTEEFIKRLEQAPDLSRCRALGEEHRLQVQLLRQRRHAAEISAYETRTLERLQQDPMDGFCLISVEPPFDTLHSMAFGFAALADVASLPLQVMQGEKPFNLTAAVTASIGDLRILVFADKPSAASYLAVTVFNANGQEGRMDESRTPWKYLQTVATLETARSIARAEAKQMQERYDALKDNDHRQVKVLELMPDKR